MQPLIGIEAAEKMDLLQFLHSNIEYSPSCAAVNTQNTSQGILKKEFLRKYPTVFSEEVGQFSPELHLENNRDAYPVQCTAQRVPIVMKIAQGVGKTSVVRSHCSSG